MYLIDRKNILWKRLKDEIIVLNVKDGMYYSFDQVGGAMWEMIVKGFDEIKIRSTIAHEYGATKSQIEKDLKKFLQQLQKEKLILKK